MSATQVLPARLEGAALGATRAAILEHRGHNLTLSGEGVERINGLGLQLLMSAFTCWSRDGFTLRIADPSATLQDAFRRLNITQPELGDVS